MQLRQLAAIKARQHDRAARMARRRGDQPVDQTRGLGLVAPDERLDDAMHVAVTLAGVLDEVEILVGSDLLDADEHGAAPCSSQSTTSRCVTTSKIVPRYCDCPDGLAPQHGAAYRTSSGSADLSNRFPQNRGSWVRQPRRSTGGVGMVYKIDEGQLLHVWMVISCIALLRASKDPLIQSEFLTRAQMLLTAFLADLKPLHGDRASSSNSAADPKRILRFAGLNQPSNGAADGSRPAPGQGLL